MIISVDIETDGPCPGLYSMISLGAVNVRNDDGIYFELHPISNTWLPEALAVSGLDRDYLMASGADPKTTMLMLEQWLYEQRESSKDRITFMSDNAGFDWQFVNYYFHAFLGRNPFGWSPMSLTWFAKGLEKDMSYNKWKKLRKTKHTHNALDDARGNAEAYRALREKYGFK